MRKRWKGKWISEAVYNKRVKQTEAGRNRRKVINDGDNSSPSSGETTTGYRLIDYDLLKKKLHCQSCNTLLDLEKTEDETRRGLLSVFKIRCDECFLLNSVPTSNSHINDQGNASIPDVNSRVALGALHAGIGHAQVEKMLTICGLHAPSSKTFKRREREVGRVVEQVAKSSCMKAAALERELTIRNSDRISELFCDTPKEFFIPTQAKEGEVTDDDVVRCMASFDMGYSGRGFDSLNGYAALIGSETGLVIDYVTENRKCRMCELGHSKNDHDCRLNFYGSAKAMEAHAAARVCTESAILAANKLQVGVFAGDNDSSSICAVRKAADHPVLKVSDKNHTSKGVKNMLWRIAKNTHQDPDHELTTNAINYLHKNFAYAVAQNKGQSSALAGAVRNIPYHAFNDHQNCGTWCGFIKNPQTYDHKTVPGGFANKILFNELKTQFDKLAANSHQYCIGASTQANESLNNTMARKCPKSSCYSVSESSDFRYACAVGQKNEGDRYTSQTLEYLNINPSEGLNKLIKRNNKLTEKRRSLASKPEFKRKRLEVKKIRSQLRNRKEQAETNLYEKHVGLLESDEENVCPTRAESTQWEPASLSSYPFAIVFFDLETDGFQLTCNLLQIAMKHRNSQFNEYITPLKMIRSQVTEVNGLSNEGGQMFYRGNLVPTSQLLSVLQRLVQFLKGCNKPCILVAHNCPFDAPRLVKAIQDKSLLEEFREVVAGFVDTLPLFRKKFPERSGKGQCKLTTLAEETLALSISNAHNADYDVYLLEMLTQHHFTLDEIANSQKTFDAAVEALLSQAKCQATIGTLDPLKNDVSLPIRKRMASAGITYSLLTTKFAQKGPKETIELLQQKINGKATVIKTKRIIDVILKRLSH